MDVFGKRQTVGFLLSASLFFLALFPPHLTASALTLAWDPNTEPDLAGYQVYYGTQPGMYDFVLDVGNITQYTVTGLEPETRYYFALTAYDTSWNESDFSDEVSAVTGNDPSPTVSTIESEEGGCFIATAAYGSYVNPHVKVLRDFRDISLCSNSFTRKFVHLYYEYGPWMAKLIGKSGLLRSFIRQALLPLIGMSALCLKTSVSQRLLLLLLSLLIISLSTLRHYHCCPRERYHR